MARPNVVLVESCAALGSGEEARLIAAAHAAGIPVATPVPFPGLLLGADELAFAPAARSEGTSAPAGDGFGYADIAGLTGMLRIAIASRLSVLGEANGPDLAMALGRGARVVPGSAAPLTPYGRGLHEELRLLVAAACRPSRCSRWRASMRQGFWVRETTSARSGPERSPISSSSRATPGRHSGCGQRGRDHVGGRPYERAELARPGGRGAGVGNLYN